MKRAEASPARLYRRLLVVYPSAFRARYADEMVQLFEDQLRDVRRSGAPGGSGRAWLRALRDLAIAAATEHARRDRTLAHSLATAPSNSSRALGLVGIIGGLVLVAAFLPNLPWTWELVNLRLVLFNLGAIAIAIGVHLREVAASGGVSRAVLAWVILANAWYIVMVILSIGRPHPPQGDPEFRLVMDVAALAMWLGDAAFGMVALRLGVARWGALALAVGSTLAVLGMSRLELVSGPYGEIIQPIALAGIALNGIGWILLGVDVAFRRRHATAPPLP